jgi:CheY-like chemotaxis protein
MKETDKRDNKHDELNILYVEDGIQEQEFMSSILKFQGCKMDSAFDGTTAIEAIKKNNYDLIFLDLEIPEVHGLDVLSIVGTQNQNTKLSYLQVMLQKNRLLEH